MTEWEKMGLDEETYNQLVQIAIDFNVAGISVSLDDLNALISNTMDSATAQAKANEIFDFIMSDESS